MHSSAVTPAHASPLSDDRLSRLGAVAQVISVASARPRPTQRERAAEHRVQPPIADRRLVDEQQRDERGGDEPGDAEHEHPATVHPR